MTIVRNIVTNGMIFVFAAAILFLAAILDFLAELQWAPNQVVFKYIKAYLCTNFYNFFSKWTIDVYCCTNLHH